MYNVQCIYDNIFVSTNHLDLQHNRHTGKPSKHQAHFNNYLFFKFLPVACPIAFKSLRSLVTIPRKADCHASQPTQVALIAP